MSINYAAAAKALNAIPAGFYAALDLEDGTVGDTFHAPRSLPFEDPAEVLLCGRWDNERPYSPAEVRRIIEATLAARASA